MSQFFGSLCASTRGRSFSPCIGMLAKLQKSPHLVFLNDHKAQIDHRALLNGQVRGMKALDGVDVEVTPQRCTPFHSIEVHPVPFHRGGAPWHSAEVAEFPC